MEYIMSDFAHKYLTQLGEEYRAYFDLALKRYFKTGEEPKFWNASLNDLWFYLKTHELSIKIAHENWWGTFEHLMLQEDLVQNNAKFENKLFKVKRHGQ